MSITAIDYNQFVKLFEAGDHAGLELAANRLLSQDPDAALVWKVLGVALAMQGKPALTALETAARLLPDDADAHNNLGAARQANNQSDEAISSYQRALQIKPDYPEAYHNLGNALLCIGKGEAAIENYKLALAIKPDYALAHNNLGNALQSIGKSTDALIHYRHATSLIPSYADAHSNIGHALHTLGLSREAYASYRHAMALDPYNAAFHSNALFCLTHDEHAAPADVYVAHQAYSNQFEHRLPQQAAFTNSRQPQRRLRLGFVSADLRDHVVAYFIMPVWAALDKTEVEIWAYCNHNVTDAISEKLRKSCQGWRHVLGLSDDALAAQIRADQIDILFDLSGHTGANRLLTFARKPAPLQVTWIGYPNTTGLRAMDYVLCDRFNAPYGLYEHWYVEKFARIPSSGTFTPAMDSIQPNPLPALSKGYITFGSFNRSNKLGEQVIAGWSAILRAVADSRLLLGDLGDPVLIQAITERFAVHGIHAERLAFYPRMPLSGFLALHHEVDIILDTWPYTGGTTSNYALWMGVPVLTLRGPSRSHCQSAAVLGRMGLENWVAGDIDEFVHLAVQWTNSLQALASLRAGMRERWQNAPLRQPATIARGLEKAVRHMWGRWCDGLAAADFEIADSAIPILDMPR